MTKISFIISQNLSSTFTLFTCKDEDDTHEIGRLELQHTPTSPRQLILTDFYVDADYRNTGIGSSLFQQALEALNVSLIAAIFVVPVPYDNTLTEDVLRTIYQHLGFEEIEGEKTMKYSFK